MSTKKTVDTEIVEDVEKIEPEVIEEVKEPVVDDVKEIASVVKAPLRGISTPSMIHTHLDNFLAKLCGETPVDQNVRNSLEYWINELANGNGGSTKKIYWHSVYFKREGDRRWYTDGYVIILNNDPTPITATAFISLLKTPGFFAIVYNGRICRTSGSTLADTTEQLCAISYRDVEDTIYVYYLSDSNPTRASSDISLAGMTVQDLGTNPIN